MRFNIGFPVVRTDRRSFGRTYGHVITKISRMGILPHFLRNGATLAGASRARVEPPLAFLHVRLKTMAHFINATGELGHNEMYIHIVF